MNLKLKSLVIAVAMTVAGVAQAAIYNDNLNSSADLGSGTGAGELMFSIYDPGRAQSLTLDMNLTANTFRNNNASLVNTFSVSNSLLQSFIAGSANQSAMVWNLGGLSNSGFGPNAGTLTTNGNAGATIDTTSINGNALTSAMQFASNYGNLNSGLFTASNPNAAITSASGPAGFLGGAWGYNFGGSFSFNNTVNGFGSDQLMSFIALGVTDVSDLDGQAISNTFASGKWHVDAASGTVSYVGVSAVPVPAAVWLFGSGLLGLVGVSRRKSAAKA